MVQRYSKLLLIILAVFLFSLTACTSATETSGGSTGGSSNVGSGCATVQCSATTQKGARCKRRTTNCNGRCWQHQ